MRRVDALCFCLQMYVDRSSKAEEDFAILFFVQAIVTSQGPIETQKEYVRHPVTANDLNLATKQIWA